MFESMKTVLKGWLIKRAFATLNPETLKAFFSKVIEFVKDKALATENFLDDWVVEALEGIVCNEEKLAVLVAFIKTKIQENICETQHCECEQDEYELMAQNLVIEDSRECMSGEFISILAELLRVVIPLLIEYLKEKQEA